MDDGSSGQYENEKNYAYSMRKSWESRNNHDMNEKMGYGNMSDLSNCAAPPTKMEGARQNKQLSPKPASEDYNYNADR